MFHDNFASTSRRQFLLTNSSLLITGSALSATVAGAGPNDRLRLASIGVGGMGAADLGSLSSHRSVEIVALCDVDSKNLASASEKHPKAKLFRDYRKMLEEFGDSIDAVNVATPDHTHAAAAVTAMNLGKHVYCQKPLTHDVYEARRMRLIAAETKVVYTDGYPDSFDYTLSNGSKTHSERCDWQSERSPFLEQQDMGIRRTSPQTIACT